MDFPELGDHYIVYRHICLCAGTNLLRYQISDAKILCDIRPLEIVVHTFQRQMEMPDPTPRRCGYATQSTTVAARGSSRHEVNKGLNKGCESRTNFRKNTSLVPLGSTPLGKDTSPRPDHVLAVGSRSSSNRSAPIRSTISCCASATSAMSASKASRSKPGRLPAPSRTKNSSRSGIAFSPILKVDLRIQLWWGSSVRLYASVATELNVARRLRVSPASRAV